MKRLPLGFPDPATAIGTDEAVLAVFRQVCDDVRQKITARLKTPHGVTAPGG